MQWFGKGSNNMEDGRGGGGGKVALGGGIGIVIVIIGLFLGKDLTGLVNQLPITTEQTNVKTGSSPDDDPQKKIRFWRIRIYRDCLGTTI